MVPKTEMVFLLLQQLKWPFTQNFQGQPILAMTERKRVRPKARIPKRV